MNEGAQKDSLYRGIGITSQKAAGRLRFLSAPPRRRESAKDGETDQTKRLERAMEETRRALERLRDRTRAAVGESEAEIFEIHAMLLEDEDYKDAIRRELSLGRTAEEAVSAATSLFSKQLLATGDDYLAARTSDLRDIARQLTDALSGNATDEVISEELSSREPYILVAEDLTPSQTVQLERSRLLGFVTFAGTPSSHTAILARAMGIPALVGVGVIPMDQNGAYALLDAASGILTLDPTPAQIADFERRKKEETELAREHDRYLRSLINKPAVTRSGHKMLIYANVGGEEEIDAALLNGADGIGLFRSELLYLARDGYPTEEELFRSYRDAVLRMNGKRIVIRTLDIGADKQIPYFELPREENPALGFRAVRICLAREEIFKTQLRAILRASAFGTVSLMIPMIVSAEEVRDCRHLLEECKEELLRENQGFDANPEFGIMIETPAAAIMSDELAAEVDFFSVGTNDLTQYTLAADRQNPLLDALCERNREPVLRLIHQAAEAIHQNGGWIGICGELAADLRLTQRFADMGIDELSVSSPYLLGVRERVIECK